MSQPQGAAAEPNLVPAGFARRLAAAAVDCAVVVPLTLLVLANMYGWHYLDVEYARLLPRYWTFLLWLWLLPAAMLLLSWLTWHSTPGKMLFTLSVVDAKSGGRASRVQHLKRLGGYYLSAATMGLGFLWAAVDREHQGLHDKIAQTRLLGPARPERARPERARGANSQWLPWLIAGANLFLVAGVYFSPIGTGDGSGVIGYSVYRGLVLVLLNTPLMLGGVVMSIAIGLSTRPRQALSGLLVNVGALVIAFYVYHVYVP